MNKFSMNLFRVFTRKLLKQTVQMLSYIREFKTISFQLLLGSKGWFPYVIADRRSQIAIRSALRSSAILWKLLLRSSAILRSRSQTIAEDRTMFYLKAGFHMIADDRRPYCDLRSAIIWKPALTKRIAIRTKPHTLESLSNQTVIL